MSFDHRPCSKAYQLLCSIQNKAFVEFLLANLFPFPRSVSGNKVLDVLDSRKIALVINTGGGNTEHRLNDAIALRRATLKNKVPYCTNMSTALACLEGIKSLKTKKLEVTSLQDI